MKRYLSLIYKNWLIILLLLTALWAGKGIFKYNVYSTHDMVHHISRGFDAMEVLKEGQFPLRWAGSLNYKCGVAIYNFFYPLIYYLIGFGGIVSGGKIIFTIKLVNIASLVLATVFFYLWSFSETKNKLVSFTGAILYLFAPYRFLLTFVRGSPEYLAYAIFPAVLWLVSLTFDTNKKKKKIFFWFLASITGGFLTISHNFTVMFLMPVILIFIVYKLITNKFKIKDYIIPMLSFLSIFGLGAFFIFPALIEQRYVKIGVVNVVDYKQHFPTLTQLIRSKWDYFYSAPGVVDDGMSFMLGYAHWFVLIIGLLLIIYWIFLKFRFKKTLSTSKLLTFTLFLFSIMTIYLILPISLPIWEKIKLLQQIQFSWRLLGIAVFFISSLAVFLLASVKKSWIRIMLAFLFCLFAIVGNRNHLLPQPVSVEDLYLFDDYEKLHYHRYATTTLGDDIISSDAPEACSFSTYLASTNDNKEIPTKVINRGNSYGSFIMNLDDGESKKVILGLEYFPKAYEFTINGKKSDYESCLGRVCFEKNNFNKKINYISWKIVQTPIQKIFNILSLATLFAWIISIWISISKKTFKKYFPTILIAAIFFALRLYNIDKRIIFNWDQQRDAFAASSILRGDLTLLGPRILGPNGFFLPPYFFYVLAPFYLVFGNAYSIIYFLAFYSLTFVTSTFILFSKYFSKLTAIIFVSIWSVFPLAIKIDTIAWNPLFIPVIFVLLIGLSYKYLKKSNSFLELIIYTVFWLGVSFHVQGLFYLPLIFPIIVKPKNIKKITISIAKFAVCGIFVFSPILLFDIRNEFLNTNLLINLDTSIIEGGTFDVWSNVIVSYLLTPKNIYISILSYIFILFAGLINLYFEKNREFRTILIMLLSIIVLFPIVFFIYKSRPSEYYFNFLIPIVIFEVSVSMSKIINHFRKMDIFYFLVPIIVIVISNFTFLTITQVSESSLYYKSEITNILGSLVISDENNISLFMDGGEEAGFEYLLFTHGLELNKNIQKPQIELVSPPSKRDSQIQIGNFGIYLPDSFEKELLDNL